MVLVVPISHITVAQANKENAQDIIKKIDELWRGDTSEAVVEMEIKTPNWNRTMKMKMWSEGMKNTFITVLSPKKDRGVSTLRLDKEMWNFFPKINKVIKVPPSMMMGSWMGSDFTNDDLVRETSLLNDYNIKLLEPSTKENNLYIVELIPKESTATVWGKIIIKAQKQTYIPVEQVYYDEKGNKMRIMKLLDIRKFGKRTIPATMEMIPLNKEGHKTTVRYFEAKFDHTLESDVFTLRNLKRNR